MERRKYRWSLGQEPNRRRINSDTVRFKKLQVREISLETNKMTPAENFRAALVDDSDCYEYPLDGLDENELDLIYITWALRGLYYPSKDNEETAVSKAVKKNDKELAYRILATCDQINATTKKIESMLAPRFTRDLIFKRWCYQASDHTQDFIKMIRDGMDRPCNSRDQICKTIAYIERDSIFFFADDPEIKTGDPESNKKVMEAVKKHFIEHHSLP